MAGTALVTNGDPRFRGDDGVGGGKLVPTTLWAARPPTTTASFRRTPESNAPHDPHPLPLGASDGLAMPSVGQQPARWIPACAGMTPPVGEGAGGNYQFPHGEVRAEGEPRTTGGVSPRVLRGSLRSHLRMRMSRRPCGVAHSHSPPTSVIPAKAGIQYAPCGRVLPQPVGSPHQFTEYWIPAFAGITRDLGGLGANSPL